MISTTSWITSPYVKNSVFASCPDTTAKMTPVLKKGSYRQIITASFDDGRAIDEALRLEVQDALLHQKRSGQRVATWGNGRGVVLEARERALDRSLD